jgi:hypothetical protein
VFLLFLSIFEVTHNNILDYFSTINSQSFYRIYLVYFKAERPESFYDIILGSPMMSLDLVVEIEVVPL